MRDYKETLDFLFQQLPMFQRVGKSAYKDNLDNTIALDNYFGHPHKNFKTIHIAGTNGKGSTSHMLASILQEAGYKTGLYTSPHLKDFRERIRVNGNMIPEGNVIEFVEKHQSVIKEIQPSFFEMTVAMAFDYFRSEMVDIAVIETGMGGRLDSTNIINPLVSVVTNIGLDHTQFLGETIPLIAKEKAGIFKHGIPAVLGERQEDCIDVFEYMAKEKNIELVVASDFYKTNFLRHENGYSYFEVNSKGDRKKIIELQLGGIYQKHNLTTVLATVDVLNQYLNIVDQNIEMGFKKVVDNTGLKGRWQILNSKPLTICDTGHNEHGVKYVLEQLAQYKERPLHIVFGMVSDKSVDKVLKMWPKNAHYYFTQASIPRAMPVDELFNMALKSGFKGEKYCTVEEAYYAAQLNAQPNDVIFIGGSTFVVAEIPIL